MTTPSHGAGREAGGSPLGAPAAYAARLPAAAAAPPWYAAGVLALGAFAAVLLVGVPAPGRADRVAQRRALPRRGPHRRLLPVWAERRRRRPLTRLRYPECVADAIRADVDRPDGLHGANLARARACDALEGLPLHRGIVCPYD